MSPDQRFRDFPLWGGQARARAWLDDGPGRATTPPRQAATVLLVRDGAAGVEVFMLRRASTMAFAPRTWVFPGGGVDPRDADDTLPWEGPSPSEWAARLGCDEPTARVHVVAAVREVFEECGVLLAGPAAGTGVADVTGGEWRADRAALLSREQSLAQLLARRGLALRSDLLGARAHWVTPEFEPRRYDARFFAALLPTGQVADADTTEAEHGGWVDPAELLAEYAAGSALLLPPTVVCVEEVSRARTAAAFVAEWRSPTRVEPQLVESETGLVLRIPE